MLSIGDGHFINRLLFAKFLFEVLGNENVKMQSKFSLFTELWDDVCRLKNALSKCIDSFTNDDFSAMGVVSVAANEKELFISVLKAAF